MNLHVRTEDPFVTFRTQLRSILDFSFRALVVGCDGATLDEGFARVRPAAAQAVRTGFSMVLVHF